MKISIVTAVLNRANYIADSLRSLGAQNYPCVEHVIIDGASTDGTLDILRDNRIANSLLVSEEDSGIYHALNKGLLLCTGDVIGLLHSDDFFADSTILSQVAFAFSDPSVDVVYGDLDYISKNDISKVVRRWRAGEFNINQLALGWMPPHPTLFVRRRFLEKIGFFDTRYKISADYDFILRCFLYPEINCIYIRRVMVKMSLGGESNQSFNKIFSKSKEDYKVLKIHNVGGLFSIFCKNLRKIIQFV
jgi:glycosyltransferase involved in cell wall biosynthesis